MKKLLIFLALLILGTLIIAGCGTPATAPAPAPGTTAAPQPTVSTLVPGGTPAPAAATTVKPAAPTQAPATKSTAPLKPKYGGVLHVVEASGPGSPFGWPADVMGGAGGTAQLCLEKVYREGSDAKFSPELATSWEYVSDPKNASITFHLRKGVKFTDGAPFDAKALKYNYEMIKPGVNPSVTRWWKSFDLLDDYTLRVNLSGWQNILPRNFSGMATVLSSPAAYESKGLEWVRWNMVGTGAFKQVDFERDVRLKLVRNDAFWDTGKPYLLGINIEYVADEMTRVALFKTGAVDVMATTPRYASELQAAGYTVINVPASANALWPDSMNADSPWANPKVRMAAEYAIDKEGIAKAFGYGFNPAAYQIAPLNSAAFVPSITGRKYDPAKAKQLLSEAGFPNGFKSKILCMGTSSRDVPTALQSQLGAIGIQVDLDFVAASKWATYMTGTWNNALLFNAFRNFPNFNAIVNMDLGVPTTFQKSTKKPDGWEKAFLASIGSTEPEPALMQKMVQMVYDDCTCIPTTYYSSMWVKQSYVMDTGHGEMGSPTQYKPFEAWLNK